MSHQCRYCLDAVIPSSNKVHRPCDCRSYVHDACLKEWNETRKGNSNVCEVCNSNLTVKTKTKYMCKCGEFGEHCFTALKVIYIIIGLLSVPLTTSLIMFAGTLFDPQYYAVYVVDDREVASRIIEIYAPLGIITGCYTLGVWGVFIFIYLMESQDMESCLKYATLWLSICVAFMVIQGLSCVIANPILGRPIAFTPRGETFGVMLALLVGLALIGLAIYGIVWYVRKYCVVSEEVAVYADKM
jgi:RING-variant domain